MSFISFLNEELKHRPEWEWTRPLVEPVLDVVSDQGHSGGSMSAFYPFLKEWISSEEPIAVKEQDMIYPIYLIIKDYDKEQLKTVAEIISRVLAFKAFTPAEDLPDQWIQHAPDTFQHKRCGALFKNSQNGKPYYLDAIVLYSPSETFSSWVGTTRVAEVPMPFDAYAFKSDDHFFETHDYDLTREVKSDPTRWLRDAGTLFSLGFNPLTSKANRHHHVNKSQEDASSVIQITQEQINLLKPKLDEYVKDMDNFLHQLSFNFYLWGEPAGLKELTLWKYHKNGISYLVENVVRLIMEYVLAYKDGKDVNIGMDVFNVYEPSKHHQGWELSTDKHVGFLNGQDLYYDSGTIISPSESKKYLYKFCKDNNLAYKGKRK